MYRIILTLLLASLGTLVMAQPGARPNYDLGIPGATKPRSVTTKKPKIKFQNHQGKMLLKTDLIINGTFKYIESKSNVPYFQFIDQEYPDKKKQVNLSMVEHLIVEGTERGISARIDSTEFQWIDDFKDLYRKVRQGEIKLFDNSRIVNEEYEFLTDYIMLGGRDGFGYKVVNKISDLSQLMEDRPYFMMSAKATNRYKTRDPRIFLYLVDLFNDPDPLKVLKWEDMKIVLNNGKTLRGKGYIQPMDMRNEYIESSNAFIHFHDGRDFKLVNHHEVDELIVDGETYEEGLYSVTNKNFYGMPWTYEGSPYLVVKRIVTNKNYFFRSFDNSGQDVVILQNVAGNYIRPVKELELRKAYLEQLMPANAEPME